MNFSNATSWLWFWVIFMRFYRCKHLCCREMKIQQRKTELESVRDIRVCERFSVPSKNRPYCCCFLPSGFVEILCTWMVFCMVFGCQWPRFFACIYFPCQTKYFSDILCVFFFLAMFSSYLFTSEFCWILNGNQWKRKRSRQYLFPFLISQQADCCCLHPNG